jgi:Ca2+/Na+ antiporter
MSDAKNRGLRTIVIALILTGFFITVFQMFISVMNEVYYINIIEVVVVTFFFIIIVGIYEFNKSVEEQEQEREKVKKIEI